MLDVKDKKIVAELLVNSRISLSSLARKTGISREVALYRMNRLKKGVIIGFYTLINLEALGYRRLGCYMQLKGISAKKEGIIFSYLKDHPFITYFGPVIGRWNVVFDVIAKDDAHLKSIVSEIKAETAEHLESLVILSSGIESEVYPTKLIGMKNRPTKNRNFKDIKINDTDKDILKILSIDPRAEYSMMSSKLKLSANAIKYRILAMEKSGLIAGYTASIDYTMLGLQFYNVQVKESSDNKNLMPFLREHKNVLMYFRNIGQEAWNLDIGLLVKDSEELRDFIIELKDHFGEYLKLHDMYLVTHIIKDNIAPEGIFK